MFQHIFYKEVKKLKNDKKNYETNNEPTTPDILPVNIKCYFYLIIMIDYQAFFRQADET